MVGSPFHVAATTRRAGLERGQGVDARGASGGKIGGRPRDAREEGGRLNDSDRVGRGSMLPSSHRGHCRNERPVSAS